MSQSFLTYSEVHTKGVTKRWQVLSSGTLLGFVSWFAHWRRYTFYPMPQTVFDASCLRDVAQFCQSETDKRKAERKAATA